MQLENVVDKSRKYYKEPVMILRVSDKDETQKFPDEEILKIFSKETSAIVIAGVEPMYKPQELRSFIFSARKFFEPNQRPIIIIFTNYFMDELEYWSAIECEALQYGNVLLKCGRPKRNDKKLYFNDHLGIRLLGNQVVYSYIGHQYT